MQYIQCNSVLLAQEKLFLTQKGTFFAQKFPKSAQIATNLNLRKNSVCSGLKFLSESKLFGRGPPCPRATSATLCSFKNLKYAEIIRQLHARITKKLIIRAANGRCLKEYLRRRISLERFHNTKK